MTRKLTAKERLKIQDIQHYNSLSDKQKKQIDKIKYDAFMKRTAEAQKNKGYSTGPEMKTPVNNKTAVTLKKKAVKLKHKAKKN